MPKFRKKPVVIDAEQWNGPEDVIGGVVRKKFQVPVFDEFDEPWEYRYGIGTLEGFMTVSPGDWGITGVAGEKYPCRNDIFEQTYQRVGEEYY